jgi:hypothetical protein
VAPAPFLAPAPAPTPLVPIVPPPAAPAFPPTPPSGTSPVTSPETDEEEEEAYDMVHHMAAMRPVAARGVALKGGGGGLPALLPALVLFAALGIAAGSRRSGPRRPLAYQDTTTSRRYR